MVNVGDVVVAPDNYDNDFAGGEGIVHEVRGNEFSIEVTKASKWYKAGSITPVADWIDDNNGRKPVKLLINPPGYGKLKEAELIKWKSTT